MTYEPQPRLRWSLSLPRHSGSDEGRKTFGTWTILESTLPGVETGGGRLKGDSARCEILVGSQGCILDTLSGYVKG